MYQFIYRSENCNFKEEHSNYLIYFIFQLYEEILNSPHLQAIKEYFPLFFLALISDKGSI